MAVEVEKLIVAWEARLRDFERQMAQGERNFRSATRRMERDAQSFERRVEATFTRVGRTLGRGLGFIGIGVGLAQLPGTIHSIIEEASEIGKVADRIGIGTEALQQLRFGAKLAGVEVEQLDNSLQIFGRNMGTAAANGGQLANVLKANGVAIRDASGQVRPTIDLLRDFADLLAGAGSASEKLALAQLAFGRSGAGMVNVLNGGAKAIDDIIAAANEAGVVLGDDLVRSAELIGDRFDALTAKIGTAFKRAVLGGVDAVYALIDSFKALENRESISGLETDLEPLLGVRDTIVNEINRINEGGATFGIGRSGALANLSTNLATVEEQIAAIEARLENLRHPPSSHPGDPADRGGATVFGGGGSERERKAVEELIAALQEELTLVRASDLEKEIANQLRRAGAAATEEERAQIEALATALYNEKAALEAQEKALEEAAEAHKRLVGVAQDFARSFVDDLLEGKSAAEALGGALQNLAGKLLDMALNNLVERALGGLGGGGGALLGGGGGGGILRLLGGLFGGFRAEGGPVSPNKAYMVGERGKPELFVPTSAGTVVPRGGMGGVTVAPVYHIDASGADPEAIRRLEAALVATNRSIERRAVAAVQTAQRRFG